MRILLYSLLLLLGASCYEDRTGCLDPDAANYDLQADLGCLDCCTFPALSVRITSVWQDSALVVGQTYRDGANNTFQFVRFRYYLGSLRLESSVRELPDPVRPVELRQRVSGDTAITLNGNYLLATLSTATTAVGTISTGGATIEALSGTYGLDDRYRQVIPSSAPTGDALGTQPGRLNYNDGRGYAQARLEYTLTPGGDTLSATSYGNLPFVLPFGQDIQPRQGFDLRVDVQAELFDLLGTLNLASDTATVAQGLGAGTDFLTVTGLSL